MKKKILYSVLAIALTAVVIFAYVQMNGNPVEKNKSKESLEAFLEQTYPDLDYVIKRSADYGWVDATYLFTVVTKDELGVETAYPYYVSSIEPYEILGDTIHVTNVDEEASNKLNEQAEEYILALLQERVPELESVSTDVEVYNNEAEEWTPQLKTPKPLLIMTEMDKEEWSTTDRLEQSKMIQDQLNQASIQYDLAEIGYRSLVNGEEQYDYISFTPEQELTLEDVENE